LQQKLKAKPKKTSRLQVEVSEREQRNNSGTEQDMEQSFNAMRAIPRKKRSPGPTAPKRNVRKPGITMRVVDEYEDLGDDF